MRMQHGILFLSWQAVSTSMVVEYVKKRNQARKSSGEAGAMNLDEI